MRFRARIPLKTSKDIQSCYFLGLRLVDILPIGYNPLPRHIPWQFTLRCNKLGVTQRFTFVWQCIREFLTPINTNVRISRKFALPCSEGFPPPRVQAFGLDSLQGLVSTESSGPRALMAPSRVKAEFLLGGEACENALLMQLFTPAYNFLLLSRPGQSPSE